MRPNNETGELKDKLLVLFVSKCWSLSRLLHAFHFLFVSHGSLWVVKPEVLAEYIVVGYNLVSVSSILIVWCHQYS